MESATRSAEDAEVRGVENESNDRPPTTLPWLSHRADAALAEKQLAVEAAAAAEKAAAAAEKTKAAAQPPLSGRFGPLLDHPDTDDADADEDADAPPAPPAPQPESVEALSVEEPRRAYRREKPRRRKKRRQAEAAAAAAQVDKVEVHAAPRTQMRSPCPPCPPAPLPAMPPPARFFSCRKLLFGPNSSAPFHPLSQEPISEVLSQPATEEKAASGSKYSYGDSKPQESSIKTISGKIEKKPPLNSHWCGGSEKVAGISEKPPGSKAYSKPQEVRIRNGIGTFVQKLWSLASRCQADATTAMVHLVVTFSVAVIMSCCSSSSSRNNATRKVVFPPAATVRALTISAAHASQSSPPRAPHGPASDASL